jgi:hypothetical protein
MEYDEQYEDYYQGDSLLESKAVVTVNITDANAHAWVEVYDEKLGWQVADVTPSSGEEESDNGFWQRLLSFLGGSAQTDGSGDSGQDAAQKDSGNSVVLSGGKRIGTGILILGAFLFTIFIVKYFFTKGICVWEYAHAGYNDRLVTDYQRHLERVSRREEALRQKCNYRQQIQWMAGHGYWDSTELALSQAITWMEQAGFSNRELTEEEFQRMRSCFRQQTHR